MKLRITLLFLASLAMSQLQANPITRSQAREVAQGLVSIQDTQSDDVPVAPYYVFSRGAGQGYVIVSGDDRTAPVFGYTDMGDFNYESLPLPMKQMLDAFAERISKLQQQPDRQQVRRSAKQRLDIARRGALEAYKEGWTDVAPLVKTHWHQSAPYNNLCPDSAGQHAVTGCVATMGAQLAYFFKKDNPDTLKHATPTYSYGVPVTRSFPAGTPIDWKAIKLSGTGTAHQDSAVATLMAALGAQSYLTYGLGATSGYMSQMQDALSYQMNIVGERFYKSEKNYSLKAWEQLIYNALKTGAPCGYTGANESSGGHAVVLDGYQASTGLFHFNFGWGGQGDGYYTVDDSTGMNGFNTYQECFYNLHSTSPNLKGEITVGSMYKRTQGDITFTLTNNSSIPYRGVNVYIAGRPTLPSSPTFSDKTTLVPCDESKDFTFSYKPTSTGTYYVFFCDNYNHILDSCAMEVQNSVAYLNLDKMSLDYGKQVVEHDGITYGVINNTTINLNVTLTNSLEASTAQPVFRARVFELNEETNTWSNKKNQNITTLIFEPGETRDTVFTIKALEPGKYYCVQMDTVVRAGVNSEMTFSVENALYFMVQKPDLAVSVNGRHATVTGNWNPNVFAQLNPGSHITTYDITGVKELDETPLTGNANALFIANSNPNHLKNVIVDGVCEQLIITPGYDFLPKAPFTAQKASLLLPKTGAGAWGEVLVPFEVTCHKGILTRVVSVVKRTSLTLENIDTIPAMTPVLYMTNNDEITSYDATDVTIGTDSIGSILDGVVFGNTISQSYDAACMLFGQKNNQPYYLVAAVETPVAPFATVINANIGSGYRALVSATIDSRLIALADSINAAYKLLKANEGIASQDKVATFIDAINVAADYYDAHVFDSKDQIMEYVKNLIAAMEDFMTEPTTAIDETIITDRTAETGNKAAIEYYSVSGVRLEGPRPGIVIIKQGDKTRKVVIRQ